MKRFLVLFLPLAAMALLLSSCKGVVTRVSTFADRYLRGEVVARAGDSRLYKSDLEGHVSSGLSPKDSVERVRQYIDDWAEEELLVKMAGLQQPQARRELEKEVEEYRRALVRYRFTQIYLNQRMDTVVTDAEIRDYYDKHPQKFHLARSAVKVRYVVLPEKSSHYALFRKKISSHDYEDAELLDSLASRVAIRYGDGSDSWMDVLDLAQELGTDLKSLRNLWRGGYWNHPDDEGNIRLVYVFDIVRPGAKPPVDFCAAQIRDIILSTRRHDMESDLGKRILEDARKNGDYVVF